VHAYLQFCDSLGIRQEDAIPASYDLVAAWASSFAGRLSGKTVGTKISALKKLHVRLGYNWSPGNLQQILKGIEEMRPTSSFCQKRAPITIPMLLDIDKHLVRSDPLDACIRCVLLLCFFCQLRAGELLCPTENLANLNHSRHPTFAHISESTAENGAANLHLPWSKTEKAQCDDVWIPQQEPPLDPIHALHKHFVRSDLELTDPIALYCKPCGTVIALTRSGFICHINQILQSSGKAYPCITGHCTCIGGTIPSISSRVYHQIWLRSLATGGQMHSLSTGTAWTTWEHCILTCYCKYPTCGEKPTHSLTWSSGESHILQHAFGLILTWVLS
jgi:hypothetical protein